MHVIDPLIFDPNSGFVPYPGAKKLLCIPGPKSNESTTLQTKQWCKTFVLIAPFQSEFVNS